jgi:hypothetical protein
MKIAVFGDSFAADLNMPDLPLDHVGWVQATRQILDQDIHNHAVGGSSMYYSWEQFTDLHAGYDRVIFLVTQWDRHYIDMGDQDPELNWIRHQTSIDQVMETVQQLKRQGSRHQHREKLESLRDYWIHVGNDRPRQRMHDLMLRDIRTQRPDCLIMSGFGPQGSRLATPNQSNMSEACMIDLEHYFLQELNGNIGLWSQHYVCHRHNHMNRLNNATLAQAVSRWIATHDVNEVANLTWQTDPEHSWDYYFRKKK